MKLFVLLNIKRISFLNLILAKLLSYNNNLTTLGQLKHKEQHPAHLKLIKEGVGIFRVQRQEFLSCIYRTNVIAANILREYTTLNFIDL